jgi:hypothetical protein
VKYGLGVMATTVQFALQNWGILRLRRFSKDGRKLDLGYYARTAVHGQTT